MSCREGAIGVAIGCPRHSPSWAQQSSCSCGTKSNSCVRILSNSAMRPSNQSRKGFRRGAGRVRVSGCVAGRGIVSLLAPKPGPGSTRRRPIGRADDVSVRDLPDLPDPSRSGAAGKRLCRRETPPLSGQRALADHQAGRRGEQWQQSGHRGCQLSPPSTVSPESCAPVLKAAHARLRLLSLLLPFRQPLEGKTSRRARRAVTRSLPVHTPACSG